MKKSMPNSFKWAYKSDLAKSRHQKGIWTKIVQIINKNYGRFQSIQIDMKLVK